MDPQEAINYIVKRTMENMKRQIYNDAIKAKEEELANMASVTHPVDRFNMIVKSLTDEEMVMLQRLYIAFNHRSEDFINHIMRARRIDSGFSFNRGEKVLIDKIYDLYKTLDILRDNNIDGYQMSISQYVSFRRDLIRSIMRWKDDMNRINRHGHYYEDEDEDTGYDTALKAIKFSTRNTNDGSASTTWVPQEPPKPVIPDDLDEDGNVIYY